MFGMEVIASVIMLVRVLYLKLNYFKHQAICLDYSTGHYSFVSFPTYEYELIEVGEKRTYVNRGTAMFYPKKGKKHRVLINRHNYNKVIGYTEYIGDVIVMSLFFACALVDIICRCM